MHLRAAGLIPVARLEIVRASGGLIGRIAAELARQQGSDHPSARHHAQARAIVSAIREPTRAMEEAGRAAREGLAFTAEVWRVMIDAALAED